MMFDDNRLRLCARLRERRGEIIRVTLGRLDQVSDMGGGVDPVYLEGLRVAVGVAIDYGIESLESPEDQAPPVPGALLTQARLAAQNDVGVDIVLRRYFAGHLVLGDHIVEAAERGELVRRAPLRRLLRAQSSLFDRVVSAVTEEYRREEARPSSKEQRQVEAVRALLAGEVDHAPGLRYDLDLTHVAIVATGLDALGVVRAMVEATRWDSLVIRPDETTVWAWIGTRRQVVASELLDAPSAGATARACVAVGEPAQGREGWRLAHRQAQAAMVVAMRRPRRLTRYADVALVASILPDQDFTAFLASTYLRPLCDQRGDGDVLCKTLRAFFDAGGNASSAAASLGVTRHTVTARLRSVEQRIGRPLERCAAEVEVSLRLAEVDPQVIGPHP